MKAAKTVIEQAWNDISKLPPQHVFYTPTGRRKFSLVSLEQEQLTIATAKSKASISKADFENALRYLMDQGHGVNAPCLIGSNKVYDKAGPLCQAARSTSKGRMNITYVLPILKEVGVVGIGSGVPGTAWFIA